MIRCPVDMRDQLKEIAAREGETVSTVVRRLIASAVTRARRGQPALSNDGLDTAARHGHVAG
jgi:hypothetical protein